MLFCLKEKQIFASFLKKKTHTAKNLIKFKVEAKYMQKLRPIRNRLHS